MNECLTGVREFLELLRVYLQSLCVKQDGTVFVQQEGITIGSCIAPVLCNLFMAKGDRILKQRLEDLGVIACFRYVDDFLLCFDAECQLQTTAQYVLHAFHDVFKGL